jgi:HEAT repeat protein
MGTKRRGQGTKRFARARRCGTRAAAAWLALSLAACGARETARPFELEDVVAPEIAAFDRALAPGAETAAPALDTEARDRLHRWMRQGSGSAGDLTPALSADVHALGDAAVPVISTALADPAVPAPERITALAMLGAIDTPLAADKLLAVVAHATGPEMRSIAARALANHQDQSVPALLARLRHEVDDDVVVSIGATLATFGNDAALARIRTLAQSSANAAARDDAREVLARVAPTPPPVSMRHRREIWLRIRDLGRGDRDRADDARFVLANGAAWTCEPLTRALHERDVAIRTEVARCIAALGVRAQSAGPTLEAALEDRELAPDAALALGDVGYAPALSALAQRLADGQALELRVAAARALGRLHLAEAIAPLRAAFAGDRPPALRQAAAESLIVLGRGDEVAGWLALALTSPGADADAAERALEYWLEHPDTPSPERSKVLAAWRKLAGPPGIELDEAGLLARRTARAALLREASVLMRDSSPRVRDASTR